MNLLPSAVQAMEVQAALLLAMADQVTPPLEDIWMEPPWVAAKTFVPSAEQAMAYQLVPTTVVWLQVWPESDEE